MDLRSSSLMRSYGPQGSAAVGSAFPIEEPFKVACDVCTIAVSWVCTG